MLGSLVSTSEIEATIAPYVSSTGDWDRAVRKVHKSVKRLECNGSLKSVSDNYEAKWSGADPAERYAAGGSVAPFQWGQRPILMRSLAVKRVYLLYLYRLIERLQPRSVLEVGCGTGINLVLLANRFPDIRFHGLELTRSGVEQCQRLIAKQLPVQLLEFSPEPLADTTAHHDISILQGTAADLPFPSDNFDLVVTVLALEQMEQIRAYALREIGRVAPRAVLIEPFRDWNRDGLRRRYTRANGYFGATVGNLPRYGLKATLMAADHPMKVHLGVGVVVTERAEPRSQPLYWPRQLLRLIGSGIQRSGN